MSVKLTLKKFTLLLFISFSLVAHSQTPDLLSKPWKAHWINVPNESLHDYGVYQFRKTFTLTTKPASFIVNVSADNRYKLFVNGKFVSLGPARGDIFHWNFETLDIAPYLQNGKNVIAAIVWNYGDMRPEAQISYQTGFSSVHHLSSQFKKVTGFTPSYFRKIAEYKRKSLDKL